MIDSVARCLREQADQAAGVIWQSVGGRGQLVELIAAGLSIVLINLVLSGDNAVVIGMAAHRLPQHQRRMAILFGVRARRSCCG